MKSVPTNLSNLKSKEDKLDVDKLVHVPVLLSKLSDVVKNDAKIKTIEDEIPGITNLATNVSLNAEINEIKGEIPSITHLATTAFLNAKINEVKDEIPDITNLATNASLHAKINEVKDEISGNTSLATTTALTAVKNKKPNVSNLVKKENFDPEISEMENNYYSTSHYVKFTNNMLDTKITQKS